MPSGVQSCCQLVVLARDCHSIQMASDEYVGFRAMHAEGSGASKHWQSVQ